MAGRHRNQANPSQASALTGNMTTASADPETTFATGTPTVRTSSTHRRSHPVHSAIPASARPAARIEPTNAYVPSGGSGDPQHALTLVSTRPVRHTTIASAQRTTATTVQLPGRVPLTPPTLVPAGHPSSALAYEHLFVYGRPMWLAGVPVSDEHVVELVRRLRESDLGGHADHLERALDRGARIVALDVSDREAILQALEGCPDTLADLRGVLVDEHLWRAREGLEPGLAPCVGDEPQHDA